MEGQCHDIVLGSTLAHNGLLVPVKYNSTHMDGKYTQLNDERVAGNLIGNLHSTTHYWW
jgi:hypothetical protein